MLAAAVTVERRLTGDVDGAAGDEQVAVGINGICIAGTHGDGNSTAVDLDLYVQGGGFPAGVDAVIRGVDIYRAVVNDDLGSFDALPGSDGERPAIDRGSGGGMDAVVTDFDGEGTALDHDITGGIIIVVLCMKSVITCSQFVHTVAGINAVMGLQRGIGCVHDPGSAGELQIIIRTDAIALGRDGHGAQAVQYQVIP